MTIDEAIEVLEHITLVYKVKPWRERAAAIELGIEALKHLKTSRDPSGVPPYGLLPGETEE